MQKPRVGIHEVVGQMVEAIGLKEAGDARAGTKIVADFLGVGISSVYKWTDPDQNGEISFANMCRLSEFYRVTIGVQHLSHMAGGVFVQVNPGHPCRKVWLASAREIGGDTASAMGALMQALEDDGDVSADEIRRHRIRALVQEAIRELVTLDHNLQRVEKGEEPKAVDLTVAEVAA